MKLTNCNCGTRVLCNCNLSFSEYLSPSLSVLSVGVLLGGECILDEYVIDWYRDGVLSLVTGVGSDADIQAYHPFLGLEAIPVLPGNWVPVVRYIVVNGVQLFNEPKPCKSWCSWSSLLPAQIVVSPLNCDSISEQVTAGYNFRMSYTSSQDYALAYRVFAFELPDDLSTEYVALMFTGYTVADRIDVFWNDETTPVFSAICGSGGNWNLVTMPYTFANTIGFKFLIKTAGYSAGDFLRFEVTPSVYGYNTNTNWMLDIACLDSSVAFQCDYYTAAMQTITDIAMAEDPATCTLTLYAGLSAFAGSLNTLHPLYDSFIKYLGLQPLTSGNISWRSDLQKFAITMNRSINWSNYGWTGGSGSFTQINSAGNINITKTGAVTVITCDEESDYLRYYTAHEALMAGVFYTEFVNDPTNAKYYRRIYETFNIAAVSCGDTSTRIEVHIHILSPIVYDAALKTITITTSLISNGIEQQACDSKYTAASLIVSYCNQYHNRADFNYNTRCTNVINLAYGMGLNNGTNPASTYNASYRHYIYGNLGTPCAQLDRFCLYIGVYFQFALLSLAITFTGTPEFQNYEVRSTTDANGCYVTPGLLIYKMVAGIVTINNLPSI